MALINAAKLKIIAATSTVSGSTGACVVYKDEIIKWFNHENKSFLVQVTADVTEFTENYACFSAADTYKDIAIDCQIKKIKTSEQKQINLSDLKTEKITSHDELKNNHHYFLTINLSQWKGEKIASDANNNLVIKPKEDHDDEEKEYVKLKVIATLENKFDKQKTEKIKFFVGKVSDIKKSLDDSDTEYSVNNSDRFLCTFEETSKKNPTLACQMFLFAEEQNQSTQLSSLTFQYSEKTIAQNKKIEKEQYYLIKVTQEPGIEWKTFNSKQIIYSQINGRDKKIISFKETMPAILTTIGENEKNLLLINK